MSEHKSHGEGHGHHIIPYKVYYMVFGSLIFLTITTVEAASFDLGVFHVPVAIAIAIAKASLVVMFFMALKYDSRVNIMVFSVGLLFVLIFLGFTLLDTQFRGALDPILGSQISQQDAVLAEQQARSDEVETLLKAEAADTTAVE